MPAALPSPAPTCVLKAVDLRPTSRWSGLHLPDAPVAPMCRPARPIGVRLPAAPVAATGTAIQRPARPAAAATAAWLGGGAVSLHGCPLVVETAVRHGAAFRGTHTPLPAQIRRAPACDAALGAWQRVHPCRAPLQVRIMQSECGLRHNSGLDFLDEFFWAAYTLYRPSRLPGGVFY